MEKKIFHLPSLFQIDDDIFLHMISLPSLYTRLDTDPIRGLTYDQAKRRLKTNGPNTIDKPDFETTRTRILRKLFRGFMGPVWFAAFLSVLVYVIDYLIHNNPEPDRLVVAFILLLSIVVSTVLRYWHAFDEEEIWRAFKLLQPRYCTVWRNSHKQVVKVEDIVMGDIVHLMFGDRVAADVRIIKSDGLIIDNVALRGSMSNVALDPNATDQNALSAPNIAFACSFVVSGSGKAVVIATGRKRLISRLASISGSKKSSSIVEDNARSLTNFNYGICVSVTFVLMFTVIFTSMTWIQVFGFLTGFIVACVPLGLATSTHFGLSCARNRLLAKNCLVQNIEAIEMIGSTTVICSEMIGILTMQRLTVTDVYFDNQLMNANEHEMHQYVSSDSFKALCLSATLCNNANVKIGSLGVPDFKKDIVGDSVDKAILKYVRMFFKHFDELRIQYEKIADKPHTAKDKHQISVHHFKNKHGKMRLLVLMKGDLDTILKYCVKYLIESEPRHLDDEMRANIIKVGHTLRSAGKRVVGFCDMELDATLYENLIIRSHEFQRTIKKMRFLGILALYDPPRPTVRHAVDICRSAGIKIVLMTSASVHFAQSIAVSAGLVIGEHDTIDDVAERLFVDVDDLHPNLNSSVVVDSRRLRGDLEGSHMENILCTHADVVFAYVMDDQRVLIVDTCRRLGAIVVGNGSSVLNSPSVRIADIGIAKGITCSKVVKCCADFILLDDSFMTIVIAIEEGRLLFQNMKKCVAYILSSNMPQILSFLGFLILYLPMPICVQVALLADIIIDLFPSLTLYYEKAEENLMNDKPRVDLIINRQMIFLCFLQIGLIEAAAAFLTYFIIMARDGFFPWDLIGIRNDWDDIRINDLTDSYGQEWTYEERIYASHKAGSGFFIAIATLQAVNLIVTRTSRENLIFHGFDNCRLNVACILMPAIIILLCHVNEPKIFHLTSLPDSWWAYILPFGGLLFLFETVRRYFLRAFPGCWVELETYY